MIRIAIVEDDSRMEAEIRRYILQYARETDQKIEVISFSDGEEITENYKLEYDVILMDVQMQFMDGITASRQIRERDQDVVIMFITNMAEYAIHGYEVNALDYVLKPINYFAFSQKLNKALEKRQKREKDYLTITVGRGIRKLDIAEIRYIESQEHKLIFHMAAEA